MLDLNSGNQDPAFLDYYNSVILRNDTLMKGHLGNVTVTSKKVSVEDSLNNEYTWGPFGEGKAIDPKKYPHYSNPWQILMASIPGITIEVNPDNPSMPGVGFKRFMHDGPITFYLNELEVDQETISTVALQDIALIKVLKNEAAPLGAPGGAIAFYTHKGSSQKNLKDEASNRFQKHGYSPTRIFYVPEIGTEGIADKRITLFWSANIKPASDGNYKLSVKNDDSTSAYKIIIQGIDELGKMIFTEQLFESEVRKN